MIIDEENKMESLVIVSDKDVRLRCQLINQLQEFMVDVIFKEFSSIQEAQKFLNSHSRPIPTLLFTTELPPENIRQEYEDGAIQDIESSIVVIFISEQSITTTAESDFAAQPLFFMKREEMRSPLLKPFVLRLVDISLHRKLKLYQDSARSIRSHMGTLQHEINNPIEVLLGAAYLLQNGESITDQQRIAARMVEKSGRRIKKVVDTICTALEQGRPLESVIKGGISLFHIPDGPEQSGDSPAKRNCQEKL
ncbi:hypothetical protein EBR25_08955 [bacterium]|nr:hypothetical protein [bacterium]